MRTAESVVFTLCPPGPVERMTSILRSFSSIATSTSSASGMTATVAVEVWIRPCDSVSGTRWTRCVPPSYLKTENAPWPFTAKTTSLNAARLVLARRERLRLEAAALRVAGEHPVEVARPERRLVAADALPDLDDHVLLVRRILLDERELELLLEPRDVLPRARRPSPASSGIVARVLEVGARLLPLLGELVRRLELLQPAPGVGGLAVVVVDGRIGHALLRLRVGALQLVDEALDRGHRVIVAPVVGAVMLKPDPRCWVSARGCRLQP